MVTGAAGFIGSHLCEQLLSLGWDVCGIDCFTPYYDPATKRANVAAMVPHPRFRLVTGDLCDAALTPSLDEETIVFHLAGEPGVRASWRGFPAYLRNNVEATQRLLDACVERGVQKVVLASSSSVYGNMPSAAREDQVGVPISPYAVSKLAAEHVALAYQASHGLALAIVRYFTVYGPRQRPDMAIARFIHAIADGCEVTIYGDGRQTRDLTFVTDAVHATIQAGIRPDATGIFNISGDSSFTVLDIVEQIGKMLGISPRMVYDAPAPGDALHTRASLDRARTALGFAPSVGFRDGLERQVAWWSAERRSQQDSAGGTSPTRGGS